MSTPHGYPQPAPQAATLSGPGTGSYLAFVPWVPFTEQYARKSVPRQLCGTPRFREVNRGLTTMWGWVFTAMVPAHLIAGAINTHRANTVFNWVIPIVLVVWAAKRTAAVATDTKGVTR